MKKKLYFHLEELRRRIIFLIILFVLFLFLGMAVSGIVLRRIRADILGEALGRGIQINLVSATPFEYLVAQLKVALFISLMLLFPFLLYQLFAFMKPGIGRERKIVISTIFLTLLFFCCGTLFTYFLFLKIGASALAVLASKNNVLNLWSIDSFVTLVFVSCFVIGILFLLPLAMLFFGKAGILGLSQYRKARKAVIVSIFLFAGILTPGTDILSQILLAVPMLLLYELGIILTAILVKKKKLYG
ncbi:twin-arginine translocase subunit TatC [Candidatus Woesearchaeota archaeon]|nr:twin-arginine translocase subunit TatC [Candidatus Woesearchaeota archaeon]